MSLGLMCAPATSLGESFSWEFLEANLKKCIRRKGKRAYVRVWGNLSNVGKCPKENVCYPWIPGSPSPPVHQAAAQVSSNGRVAHVEQSPIATPSPTSAVLQCQKGPWGVLEGSLMILEGPWTVLEGVDCQKGHRLVVNLIIWKTNIRSPPWTFISFPHKYQNNVI